MPAFGDSLRASRDDINNIINVYKQQQADRERASFFKKLTDIFGSKPQQQLTERTQQNVQDIANLPETPVEDRSMFLKPLGGAKTSRGIESGRTMIPPTQTETVNKPRMLSDIGFDEIAQLGQALPRDGDKTAEQFLNMALSQREAETERQRQLQNEQLRSERQLRNQEELAKFRHDLGPTQRNATTGWQTYLPLTNGDAKEARKMWIEDQKAIRASGRSASGRAPSLIDLVRESNMPGDRGKKGKANLRSWMIANGKKGEVLRTEDDGTVVYGLPADETLGTEEVELFRQRPAAKKQSSGQNIEDLRRKKSDKSKNKSDEFDPESYLRDKENEQK